jgi:hypothetical protein
MKRIDGSPRTGKLRLCEKCRFQISSFFYSKHCEKCDGIGPKWATVEIRKTLCKEKRGPRSRVHGGRYTPAGWNTGLTKENSECLVRQSEALKATWKVKRQHLLLEAEFDSLSTDSKKKRVLYEQHDKCVICGICEWLGKPLKLRLDHIDGNILNGGRGNLRGICPNCDSQTETYCGKNRKKKAKVSDDELLASLKESDSISAALDKLGLSHTKHYYEKCQVMIENVLV